MRKRLPPAFLMVPWRRRLIYWYRGRRPGKEGLDYRRRYRKLFKKYNLQAFRDALEETRGMIAVDLGANIGAFTREMAETAGHVYAFEPDPWTADTLKSGIEGLENVTVIEAAAGVADRKTSFYRRLGFDENPGKTSEAASLFAGKINMDTQHPVEVREVDFIRFLRDLDAPVGVLKVDIEGGEVPLLERLFDAPELSNLRYIFCETHETMVPALADRTETLRERARAISQPKINMDWH